MNIMPTGSRILVKVRPVEETAYGGIYLPTPPDKPVKYADVLQVGPKATDVVVGDSVVFSKYIGTETDDGCLILKEEDVLALLKKS